MPTAAENDPRIPRGMGSILFLTAWLVFSFFHQGGGRHQNVRFAMLRAVVEDGRFAIDSRLFYSGLDMTAGPARLIRTPLVDGSFFFRGENWYVTWIDASGERVAVPSAPEDATLIDLSRVTASPYVAWADGRLHPNKAPGATLLAVPAYFVLRGVERLLDLDADRWWVLTVNAWLTSALSVGLVSALGCLVFFRLALLLWSGRILSALLATLAFAFGTMFLPYATMLYEHNVVAVALLTAVWLLIRALRRTGHAIPRLQLALAGASAGYAAISDYLSALVVLFLVVWIRHRFRRWDSLLWFGLGLVLPLLLIGFYNQVCFGTPFTTNYHFQQPQFPNSTEFLAAFEWPRFDRLPLLLFSPFRGLFLGSPVLLAGVVGLVAMGRSRERRPEALLFTAIFALYLLFNISFSGWHAYWACAPRFLGPAVPFLALPVTWCFARAFKSMTVLAVVSVAIMGLFTIVDPQSPVGLSSIASNPGRALWLRSPLTEWTLPILFSGRAAPIIEAKREERLQRERQALDEEGASAEEREARLAALQDDAAVSLLAFWRGPVSANPIGIYESWIARSFAADSSEARWNSFNAGELLLPGRWSLLPLAVLLGPLGWMLLASRERARPAIPDSAAEP